MTRSNRWSVILAGGVGSRFWPLSTPERPKQLLPLITDAPMLRDKVLAGEIDPGQVFDAVMPLAEVARAYTAMDERTAIKVMLRP